MTQRNASVAVVGAGDFIGAAIARRFAAEGYVVVAGRRHADKLAPLQAEIEAAGGRCVARGLDARREDDIAAFIAAAKAGLRAVAQSMARELGPKGIHVAHLVIDSGVNTAWVRERITASEGAGAARLNEPDRLMHPESIADTYWRLHTQTRDAWTFETDLRPFAEQW